MLFSELIQSTPDTVSYMLLGYGLMWGVGIFYVASLVMRQNNLKKDVQVIETLLDED